ncbi:MAG: hypothetical protein LBI12_05540 [Treponema sp.]|jgi:uncharacterized membrane protein|nr:hypothetical protein [Treponema sp.]
MIFNAIITVCLLPVAFIFYFMLLNNLKPKKNIILGVTLPHNAHDAPETKEICNLFKKRLNIIMLGLLLLLIPPFFLNFMGLTMVWFMTWILLAIAAFMAVFAKYRTKLMALKREKNWNSAAAGRALVDIKAATLVQKKINSLLFLPPVIAGLAITLFSFVNANEFDFVYLYVIFTSITVIFWLCYYLIFRLRTEVVDENVSVNVALTCMRRHNWGKFFLFASWLTGILVFFIWIINDSLTGYLTVTLAYSLLMLALGIYTEFATRIAQQKLTAANTGDLYLDEDDYWLLGLVYYNPNDTHLFVNDRVGINVSVNLAKTAGKVIMALSVLALLALPFLGVWMWKEEITPVKLILNENALTVRHTKDQYVVPLSSIKSVDLLETLPSMIRVGGMGLENLNKGNFRVEGYGTSRVCIRINEPPFIVIKTNDNIYIINDADSNVTKEIYTKL